MESEVKFAVLIDADNISDKYIKIIMDEIANSGIATYKRIYGDWTSPNLSSWKTVLLDNSIIPMQQYSYTSGKNSTDSAMIIDAMDILYSGTVGGFCIASSDSDFTRLAARLRESGMQVIGMGESKTPKPFISACNQFKYLDLLYANQVKIEKAELAKKKQKQKSKNVAGQADSAGDNAAVSGSTAGNTAASGGSQGHAVDVVAENGIYFATAGSGNVSGGGKSGSSKAGAGRKSKKAAAGSTAASNAAVANTAASNAAISNTVETTVHSAGAFSLADTDSVSEDVIKPQSDQDKICIAINAIIEKFSDEDGWLFSGKLGDQLSKRLPDFDVRNFGFSKLTPFIKSLGEYELDKVLDGNNQRQIYVKMKEKKSEN